MKLNYLCLNLDLPSPADLNSWAPAGDLQTKINIRSSRSSHWHGACTAIKYDRVRHHDPPVTWIPNWFHHCDFYLNLGTM
jgi:hypothetical protein